MQNVGLSKHWHANDIFAVEVTNHHDIFADLPWPLSLYICLVHTSGHSCKLVWYVQTSSAPTDRSVEILSWKFQRKVTTTKPSLQPEHGSFSFFHQEKTLRTMCGNNEPNTCICQILLQMGGCMAELTSPAAEVTRPSGPCRTDIHALLQTCQPSCPWRACQLLTVNCCRWLRKATTVEISLSD